MTSTISTPASISSIVASRIVRAWPRWVCWGGFVILALPTFYQNYRQSWQSEQGAAGPAVLALGLWLLWRRWPAMQSAAEPSSAPVAVGVGLLAAFAYAAGRVADQFLIESYAVYGFALVGIYAHVGGRGLRQGWFALAYLILAMPVPYTVSWELTSHLRLWITQDAVALFHYLGFVIERDGLDIQIDQYVLAVQDACSGMNSLFSLSAIGLVYLHLRRAPPWWYTAMMVAPIVLFAIGGNFARIVLLILLTHYFGDAVAQSFLHESAGVVAFLVALLGVAAVDAALAPILMTRKLKAS